MFYNFIKRIVRCYNFSIKKKTRDDTSFMQGAVFVRLIILLHLPSG